MFNLVVIIVQNIEQSKFMLVLQNIFGVLGALILISTIVNSFEHLLITFINFFLRNFDEKGT